MTTEKTKEECGNHHHSHPIILSRKRPASSGGSFSPSGCSTSCATSSYSSSQFSLSSSPKMMILKMLILVIISNALVSLATGEPYGSRSYGGILGSQGMHNEKLITTFIFTLSSNIFYEHEMILSLKEEIPGVKLIVMLKGDR